MATFLTTDRMSPALRARVERAVSPAARSRHAARRAGTERLFASSTPLRAAKLMPLFALGVVALLFWASATHDRHELEDQRAEILASLGAGRAAMPPGHEAFLAKTDAFVADLVREPYARDAVSPEIAAPGELDAWLARPAVYVRAPIAELRDAKRVDEAAVLSMKDAFLACLLDPPAASDDRALVARVRGVYFAGAKIDRETANVHRLVEARLGLAVVGDAFEARVRGAEELGALRSLGKQLDDAPIVAAAQAARAELMIAVADGPGEAPHDARVALVDVARGAVLARVLVRVERRRTTDATALFREAIQGCDLAVAVRAAIAEEGRSRDP